MDNKQKKQLMASLIKLFAFLSILMVGWTLYFSINSIIANQGMLWLNICLISIALIMLMTLITTIIKVKKLKNLFVTSKFSCFIAFITFLGMIAGVFVLYYTKSSLDFGYYLTIILLSISIIMNTTIIICGVKLLALHKSTSVMIDDLSEVPNYDDELMLKKKLDELNRKLEMKKVADKIEEVKKQLEE